MDCARWGWAIHPEVGSDTSHRAGVSWFSRPLVVADGVPAGGRRRSTRYGEKESKTRRLPSPPCHSW